MSSGATSPAMVTMGLLHIGPMALAIPVQYLREAVDMPATLSRMPTPSRHVLGGVDVRRELITVLDLRPALNLPAAPPHQPQRIVIIEHQGLVFGLSADRLGEVVQVRAQDCQPVKVLQPDGPPLVREIFSLDEGQRVLSVLCLDGIVQLSGTPLTQAADRQAELALRRVHQQWSPYLMFEAGHTRLCIHADLVDTVIHLDSLGSRFTPSRGCIGVLANDTRKLAVLDALDLLGLGHTTLRDNRQVLVLKVQGRSVGLLVREVNRIARQDDRTLRPVPALAFDRPELFAGLLPLEGLGDFLKIDGERLCALEPVRNMASIHGSATQAGQRATHAGSDVYLLYRVGQELASSLRSIREILPFPSQFTPIDRAGDARVGLMRHRDEVVPIFNLATLCGQHAPSRSADTRLLLIEGPQGPIALEVEQVMGIEPAQGTHPPLHKQQASQGSRLQQALHTRSLLFLGQDDQRRSMQTLDLPRLVQALQGDALPAPAVAPTPSPQPAPAAVAAPTQPEAEPVAQAADAQPLHEPETEPATEAAPDATPEATAEPHAEALVD